MMTTTRPVYAIFSQTGTAASTVRDPSARAPRRRRLFDLDVGFLHDFRPALVILAYALVKCLRRAAACDHAVAFEVLLDSRVLQRLVDTRIKPVDDGLRRSARNHR